MRIKEIELQHVRAIDHLKLDDFQETGVTVISGDNEVGKSTIADSLKFLFKYQCSSGAQEVLGMHQLGGHEPPQITARLELDGYDFTVSKTYVRNRGTCVIDIHSPSPKTIDGKAAESWLAERFENADTKNVWDVFVAEQGEAQKTLSLGGYAQISSALQEAVGQNPETDEQRTIFEAVEKELKKYFTVNKKSKKISPKSAITTPEKNLEKAKADLADARTRVQEYESLLVASKRNREKLEAAEAAMPDAEHELTVWQQRFEALDKYRSEVDKTRDSLKAAEKALELARASQATREGLIAEFEAATKAAKAAADNFEAASDVAAAEEK